MAFWWSDTPCKHLNSQAIINKLSPKYFFWFLADRFKISKRPKSSLKFRGNFVLM